jgi:arginase
VGTAEKPHPEPALTHYAGRAGDHNDRAMVGSKFVAHAFARQYGLEPIVIGSAEPALSLGWRTELTAAMPALKAMSERYEQIFTDGRVPATALSRCAVALATLPRVARQRPDAVVVWFDAHPDLNTPDSTTTGYLGGLALSGPMGWWDSGLGCGLPSEHGVLVGVRDVDVEEHRLIDGSEVTWVRIGPNMPEELRSAVDGRPAYIHIDCDVMEPGIVLTDYSVPGGLTLPQLRDAADVLAESEIVGIEVGEFEAEANSPAAQSASALFSALAPVLERLVARHRG